MDIKECICGQRAFYFCRPCEAVACKEHKAAHEKGSQRKHAFEKIGEKLSAEQIVEVVENITSIIQVTNQCENQILDHTMKLLEAVSNSCNQALELVQQKRIFYTQLLARCGKRLFQAEINELQRIKTTALVVNLPQ